MAFGTFDCFHFGHESYLKQAKDRGDYLVVVVARDKTVKELKGALPGKSEKERLKIVKEAGLADDVWLGDLKDKWKVIREYRPDIICLGYDQHSFEKNLQKGLAEMGLGDTKIVRMEAFHPERYKSSILKNSDEDKSRVNRGGDRGYYQK